MQLCRKIRDGQNSAKPTFKWSRENGSVVFPVRSIESAGSTTGVTLEHLGRDMRFGLQEGDWVEVVDDKYVLHGRSEPLLMVSSIDRVNTKRFGGEPF